jgi:hypothetical protein
MPVQDMGIDWGKADAASMAAKLRGNERLLVAAYPHFNVQELAAVAELAEAAPGVPLLLFNAELDRVRSGCGALLLHVAFGGQQMSYGCSSATVCCVETT